MSLTWSGGTLNTAVLIASDASLPTTEVHQLEAEFFFIGLDATSVNSVNWNAAPDYVRRWFDLDTNWGSAALIPDAPPNGVGVRITGEFTVATAGTYTFYDGSDDGSRLYIDGVLVVNNDGLHAFQTVQNTVYLTAGEHHIEYKYFEDTGDARVLVEWSGPGMARQVFGGNYVHTSSDTAASGTGTSLYGEGGNDLLIGTYYADVLSGGSGTDTLNAGDGDDYLIGGAGADVHSGGDGFDIASFADATAGIVLNLATPSSNTGDAVGDTFTSIEAFEGTGFADTMTAASTDTVFAGGEGNDTLNGGAGADRLYGDAGNDTLNGGNSNDVLDGGTGNDTMVGGAGNDSYYVDSSSDVVTEVSGQGSDTVYSSAANYTVGANIEYTYLTGTANNNLTGDSVTNYLYGNAGNNVLDGGGGADALYGGAGDDTYYVDNTGDVAGENGNEGRDLVIAAVTFTLATFFEDLTLTGSANINGTGNTLANTITGNGGINQLNGGDGSDTLYGGGGNDVLTGGTGADTMYGGSGDDTFYVDNAGDVVSENASEGTDTVITSIGYSIATSAQVENLTITGSAGISVTGNALGNTIMGGTGADTINGGAGADTMSGGAGNDTYVVDNAGDVVTELSNQGFDTVQSSITYTAPTNVENITLTGSSAINATGNTLANVLVGNSGANQLKGGGAADNLTGGGGADIFVFAATSDSTGSARDTIADFLSGTDKIDLSGIDANTALAGDQAFTFIGGSAFSDVAGQLQYANGMLGGDVNGDGIPDFAITITNSPSIVAADLIA